MKAIIKFVLTMRLRSNYMVALIVLLVLEHKHEPLKLAKLLGTAFLVAVLYCLLDAGFERVIYWWKSAAQKKAANRL